MNRRTYDGCKTADDLRVTTGPGRYQLDAPPQACNACFAPEPTVRQQAWGASLNNQYIKTDVESDLFNINRPTTRTVCNQYQPDGNKINQAGETSVKECSFPQTHSRLVDPPCNNRSVGWNRWEWLCDNPQESVMIPFDNLVTTRLQKRDQHRPCIPTPQSAESLLPAPSAYDSGSLYTDEDQKMMAQLVGSMNGVFSEVNGGVDGAAAPVAGYGDSASLGTAPF